MSVVLGNHLLRLPVQGYDNSESSVRKSCVFCLVAIYAVIGEELKPHLSQLSSSKVPSVPSAPLKHPHDSNLPNSVCSAEME